MDIVQAVKQWEKLRCLFSRLLTTLIPSYLTVSKPSLIYQQERLGGNIDINLETPFGADSIHQTYGICYQTIKETDEIEAEKSLEIYLNFNQPPNQLQQQSTASKSKKRKNDQGSVKFLHPQIRNLNPIGKNGNFPSNLVFLTIKSVPQYRIEHI